MDFIEGLPVSEGYDAILVVVDRFSKHAPFILLRHPFTAQKVAKLVFNSEIKLHGLPKTIVSDSDKIFLSLLWKLFSLFGTTLVYIQHITLKPTVKLNVSTNPCRCIFAVLSMIHPKSGKHGYLQLSCGIILLTMLLWIALPLKGLYGYEPNSPAVPHLPDMVQSSVMEWITKHKAHIQLLRDHLLNKAQKLMKLNADENRTNREHNVGDQVFLKLQPHTQSSVANRPYPKLCFQDFRPFKVVARMGKAAYKLDLPTELKFIRCHGWLLSSLCYFAYTGWLGERQSHSSAVPCQEGQLHGSSSFSAMD